MPKKLDRVVEKGKRGDKTGVYNFIEETPKFK
jgi:hypothetical protein